MRTKEVHAQHCGYIDLPDASASEQRHYSKVYEINRSTILLSLPNFDITQQLPQDLMHVLLEGVFPVHMEQLVAYIVQVSGVLTLAEINSRIAAFPYAYFQEKPGPISFEIQGAQTGMHV